jgi:hypothetical protein
VSAAALGAALGAARGAALGAAEWALHFARWRGESGDGNVMGGARQGRAIRLRGNVLR